MTKEQTYLYLDRNAEPLGNVLCYVISRNLFKQGVYKIIIIIAHIIYIFCSLTPELIFGSVSYLAAKSGLK